MSMIEQMRRTLRSYDRAEIERRWSASALSTAVRRGDVTRILPGHYGATEHAGSFAVRAHAAVAWADPHAALYRTAALARWGLVDPPGLIDVVVPWFTSKPTPAWLRLVRVQRVPPPADLDGIAAVRLPVALATAYGWLPREARDQPLYEAVQSGLATVSELHDAERSLARMRGRGEFRLLLGSIARGAESHLERVSMATTFRGPDFAHFERQHRIRACHRTFRLDMYDPVSRTAVELDGRHHGDPGQRQHDINRDAMLAELGVLTLRFSYRDIVERGDWCRDVVRKVLAMRGDQNQHIGVIPMRDAA